MKGLLALMVLVIGELTWADIPAIPVMTLYEFNGSLKVPYYDADSFRRQGPSAPAGTIAQGTSVIPCLVIRDGAPLTDREGTPYVGFEVVVDSRKAGAADGEALERAFVRRKSMRVANHHCQSNIRHVIDVRKLYALNKTPFFDPPGRRGGSAKGAKGELDEIIRSFHNSGLCADANHELIGRRQALARAWDRFLSDNTGRWPKKTIARAKHLDYTLRTALYEGHLDRGCNAYGACERNIVALSIRNRGRSESCLRRQGCRFPGDYQGVSSDPAQYNIWDEFLTQVSGLTSCFLRTDLATGESSDYYNKIRAMYEQSVGDVQRILYGSDGDLTDIFGKAALSDIKQLRHYYHAPAMGKCFPTHERVEYMSGAVAENGSDFALIADMRIKVGDKGRRGYRFWQFVFEETPERDLVDILDAYPGFEVDARKVELKPPAPCPPYGIPRGCRHSSVGRYRRTPPWLAAGKPLGLQCQILDRGTECRSVGTMKKVTVGDACDTQMRPVARVR